MTFIRSTLHRIAIAAVLVVVGVAAQAQPTVKMTYPENNVYRLPLYAAMMNGYFLEEGIKVEVLNPASGSDAVKMMVGGAVQFTNGPPLGAFYLKNQGLDVKIVSLVNARVNNSIIIQASKAGEIKSFADMGGHTIGVTGVGSNSWQWAIILAKLSGFDPNLMKVVSVGGGPGAVAAFKAGRIDAFSYADPQSYELVEAGEAKFLVDLADDATHRKFLGDRILFNCMYVMADYAKSKPNEVQAFANGLQKGLNWARSHSIKEAAQLLGQYPAFKDTDGKLMEATLKRSEAGVPPTAEVTEDGFNAVLRLLPMVDAQPVPFKDVVDNSFATAAAKKYPPPK